MEQSTKISPHYQENNDPIWLAEKLMPLSWRTGFYAISVVKYVTRHTLKGGIVDINKAIDILIKNLGANIKGTIVDNDKDISMIDLEPYGFDMAPVYITLVNHRMMNLTKCNNDSERQRAVDTALHFCYKLKDLYLPE